MAGPTDVDAYLAALPEDRRDPLEALRRTIRAAAPEATETIAYQMPAYRMDGRFLVSFGSYKRHVSLFPWDDAMVLQLGAEIEPYLAGRGTIRFPVDSSIPLDLVRKVVEIRLAEHAVREER